MDITMISADTYYTIYKLKETQVFTISMRDLKYQIAKRTKPETNSRSIILEKYHNFLNIFSKKDSNTLLLY